MKPRFLVNQNVTFHNQPAVVLSHATDASGRTKYYCHVGDCALPMWVPEQELREGAPTGPAVVRFNRRNPHLMTVDDFYKNPDEIRAFALEQEYVDNNHLYKGKRTKERFLWPYLKEEFERLLGRPIIDWLDQPFNGCFQITGYDDPLVWHSDTQSYAAAIYLTPQSPPSAGTSFWRDTKYHNRRPPEHPLERGRFADDERRAQAGSEIFSEYNLLHPDNWELVDRVGAVYNRLAIWDAKMIHSASTYEGLQSGVPNAARLVQLFFFTIG